MGLGAGEVRELVGVAPVGPHKPEVVGVGEADRPVLDGRRSEQSDALAEGSGGGEKREAGEKNRTAGSAKVAGHGAVIGMQRRYTPGSAMTRLASIDPIRGNFP